MSEIQVRWDEDHNVAKKLRSDEIKGNLQRFIEDISQGLEGSILLANQLQRVLKTKLKDAFETSVVREVVQQISLSVLMSNQEVIKQMLDYHLLRLCELNRGNQLIFYVTSESKHFKFFMKQLVSHKMSECWMKQTWDNVVQSVLKCLRTEPSNKASTVEGFIATLILRLTEVTKDITHGDTSLTNALRSIYVRKEHEKSIDLTDFYSKKLPKLCESLEQEPMPNVKGSLVKRVMKDMETHLDERCRSRCEIPCPGCGSACYLAKGHNSEKHDAIHQPAGLNGQTWKQNDSLIEMSCSQMVEGGMVMYIENFERSVSYSEFCSEFPEWSNPMGAENNISKQVREFIFFEYQDELVEHHRVGHLEEERRRKFERAVNIPASYNHNPKELKDKLEVSIRREYSNDEDFDQFMRVLLE
ncbi:hypothetical protein KP509_22G011900 [Ceratopteris richardii]|uniref:Uncharacterized protein n=1 Tax=Ceratopteris richardii TaxID=49495 RepID=A0A8T2S3N0_CERRI|nr:hypothetical protein KP509_22G011900 [Ceratopteris richardii]